MHVASLLSFEQALKLTVFVLVGIELFFVAVNLAHYALGYRYGIVHLWFYLDSEKTLPSWFSSSQLFAIGLVFLVVANVTRLSGWARLFFLLVALGTFFLSADETVAIHETVGRTLEKIGAGPNPLGGHSQFVWAYPLIGLVLLLLNLQAVRECLAKERRATFICALGLAIFIAGGSGIELVGHLFEEKDHRDLAYLLQVCSEEFLEMLGATVLFYGSLLFLKSELSEDAHRTTIS